MRLTPGEQRTIHTARTVHPIGRTGGVTLRAWTVITVIEQQSKKRWLIDAGDFSFRITAAGLVNYSHPGVIERPCAEQLRSAALPTPRDNPARHLFVSGRWHLAAHSEDTHP